MIGFLLNIGGIVEAEEEVIEEKEESKVWVWMLIGLSIVLIGLIIGGIWLREKTNINL